MELLNVRKDMKSKRLGLSLNDVKNLSLAVTKNLFSLEFINKKQNFFIYNSIKNEVDTAEIITTLLYSGKTVAFPLINGLDLTPAIPLDYEYVLDVLGCKIPKNYSVMTNVDVAIIPLVACDENKNRIGYGKGYYDRFLKDKNCIKIGLAYDFQVLKNITPNSWDIPLDYIITPTRIIGDIL